MNKKGSLNLVIVLFLFIILGAIFLGVLADVNWTHRNTHQVDNETLSSVSNATGGEVDISKHPVIQILYVTNATGPYVLVPTTNYSVTTISAARMFNGEFLLNQVDCVFDSEDVNISYTYAPQGYVRQSAARVLLGLIPLFFVIALLVFVIGPVLKRMDVF